MLRCTFMKQLINLIRWTVAASIEKLLKNEGLATRAWRRRAVGMAVAVVHRTFGPNIPRNYTFCLV